MKWSITSRNTIEKEGDLDLHSSINATLIFSYIEEQDRVISLDKQTYLGANIKRLMRYARSQLPTGVSDVAVIRVDRRWQMPADRVGVHGRQEPQGRPFQPVAGHWQAGAQAHQQRHRREPAVGQRQLRSGPR